MSANTTDSGYQKKYVFSYAGLAKTLFDAAKFSDRRRIQNSLIHRAAESLQELDTESSIYITLPSRKKFLLRILKACIPEKRLIMHAFTVKRHPFSKSANKLLGEAARYKRIYESLLLNSVAIPNAEKYILCDDVSTTGATLNHAAYLLKENLKLKPEQITLWALMYREREFVAQTPS